MTTASAFASLAGGGGGGGTTVIDIAVPLALG